MEAPAIGAGASLAVPGAGLTVPAFLTKLWTLVEDPETDALICWSPSGTSFHVFDQARFSKDVLPKFFKHNNMASFVRQLNMYGFRKVVHIEHGGLVKPERDDTEFQHQFFIRGQETSLEYIKRKVTTVSSGRHDEVKVSSEDVSKILTDVQLMKGKQETIDSRIIAMRHENEALWREVASLRQKHTQQQKVVNKLIHFLVSLVQSNRIVGVKRKLPLMLNDSGSVPKYSRPLSLEHMQRQSASSPFSLDQLSGSGPIISDITDMAPPPAEEQGSDWSSDSGSGLYRDSQSVTVKQEPASPEAPPLDTPLDTALSLDTPLSPTAFINSLLQENDPPTANPVVSSSAEPLPPDTAGQSGSPVPSPDSAQCQTIALIDRPRPPPSAGQRSPDVWRFISSRPEMSELSDHVDSIDNSLENLQSILNTQSFTFDASPLMEFFGSACPPGDFDLESLDSLLSDETPKGSDESSSAGRSGKQLVQYTPFVSEPISASDLLEADPFFMSPTDDSDL